MTRRDERNYPLWSSSKEQRRRAGFFPNTYQEPVGQGRARAFPGGGDVFEMGASRRCPEKWLERLNGLEQ